MKKLIYEDVINLGYKKIKELSKKKNTIIIPKMCDYTPKGKFKESREIGKSGYIENCETFMDFYYDVNEFDEILITGSTDCDKVLTRAELIKMIIEVNKLTKKEKEEIIFNIW